MTISDAIIIYLACGTPFGVHYFLKNRNSDNYTWLKALLVTSFWIPFALIQLHVYVTNLLNFQKRLAGSADTSAKSIDIDRLKKGIESYLPADYSANSLFAFREIVETYAGLSQALIAADNNQNDSFESEILRISGHSNPIIGSTCLARRNLSRLVSHQKDSRKLFVNEIRLIFRANGRRPEICEHAIKFAKLLQDETAKHLIATLINAKPQDESDNTVTPEESNKWDLEQLQRSTQVTGLKSSKALQTMAHTLKKH